MKQDFIDLLVRSKEIVIQASLVVATVLLTLVAVKLMKRFIAETAESHQLAERRSNIISKFSQTIIYLVAAAIISNILGFGIEGIFVATSSFFAIVGIAFFANWSILSNATASVILYFTFPFRIGDRIQVENEPKFNGLLRDVTLFYLKIENEHGSIITIPANVAIQKIITIQSDAEYRQIKAAQTEAADKA